MNEADFELLEDEYELKLPKLYKDLLRSGDSKGLYTCTDQILDAHEHLELADTFAGISTIPKGLMIICEDGVGGYYFLNCNSSYSPVYYYEHEADKIYEVSRSLKAFIEGNTENERTAKVIYSRKLSMSGKKAKAKLAPRVDYKFSENWQTNWLEFVEIYKSMRESKSKTKIKSINKKFGQKPVKWQGKISKIDKGDRKIVVFELAKPKSNETYYTKGCSRQVFHPRTEDDDHSVSLSKQVITTNRSFCSYDKGDNVEFIVMIAPGYENDICCIADHELYFNVNSTGIHILGKL